MSSQTIPTNIQSAITSVEENYQRLRNRICDVIQENDTYFVTLGEIVANQLTTDNEVLSPAADFPVFINRAIKLQLSSVDHALDGCLKAFDLSNSAAIKSIIDISKK